MLYFLLAKGPNILNAPLITTCYNKDQISPWIWLRVSQQWLFFRNIFWYISKQGCTCILLHIDIFWKCMLVISDWRKKSVIFEKKITILETVFWKDTKIYMYSDVPKVFVKFVNVTLQMCCVADLKCVHHSQYLSNAFEILYMAISIALIRLGKVTSIYIIIVPIY